PPAPPQQHPHQTNDDSPSERVGFSDEDLDAVLTRYEQVLDINRSDLADILRQTEMEAVGRRMGVVTCADIMSRDVITLSPEDSLHEAWKRIHRHRLHALPVVDPDHRPIGIVTLVDLLPHAAPDDF